MSQKKVYLFSPDGKEEGWFMEDDAPAGWVRSKPKPEEGSAPNINPETVKGENEPNNGEPSSQEVTEHESPPQVADQT